MCRDSRELLSSSSLQAKVPLDTHRQGHDHWGILFTVAAGLNHVHESVRKAEATSNRLQDSLL